VTFTRPQTSEGEPPTRATTLRRHEHVDSDLPPDVVEAARSLSRAGVTVTHHPCGA
jgi:hypothetical protein